ncbi:MAG: hypothetical protein PHC40_04380 [Eubacteriales bacterium]|nr:hypothetical protein [Eubacteriales bacterium]
MKVFIVFLGLLIANITFITYQGDLARYLRLQDFLKATAEECACGAAGYYDEEAFSRGEMLVNAVEAEKYVKYITAQAEELLEADPGGTLSYQIEILPSELPSVEVQLTLKTSDLFRLSFLKVEEVTRTAKYELVGAGSR